LASFPTEVNDVLTWFAQQVHDEHLYDEVKRLRKENIRLKEERDILKKAAAYFAPQLP
jgi:transposase-like protein